MSTELGRSGRFGSLTAVLALLLSLLGVQAATGSAAYAATNQSSMA